MLAITIDIDDRKLLARLEALPKTLQAALVPTITRETERMFALALSAEPQRTGALRAATQMFVDVTLDSVRGRVRVLGDSGMHAKAGALEWGAHGAAKVSAHQMMLGHLWGAAMEARAVMVDAYTRQVNIRELRFLRDAFDTVRAEAVAEIERTVNAEISRAHSV